MSRYTNGDWQMPFSARGVLFTDPGGKLPRTRVGFRSPSTKDAQHGPANLLIRLRRLLRSR